MKLYNDVEEVYRFLLIFVAAPVVGLLIVSTIKRAWQAARKSAVTATVLSMPCWSLDTPLYHFSSRDVFTIRDAYEGVGIIGGVGSGKTSGSGYQLARAMLLQGFGGLVNTVKADEVVRWLRLAKETGRLDDIVVFDESKRHRFKCFNHEMTNKNAGGGLTENIANMIDELREIANRAQGASGRSDEQFWRAELRKLIQMLVELLRIAKLNLSISWMLEILKDCAMSPDEFNDPKWRSNSALWKTLQRAEDVDKSPEDARDFEVVKAFFESEWTRLADKTRSIIRSMFTAIVDPLSRGLLRDLFCTDTTVTPEDAIERGKIIIVGPAIKTHRHVGLLSQSLWKQSYQNAVDRRNPNNPRGCFLFIDEAQNLLTARDMQFAATSRSNRCANIWLTQNISNLYVALGGDETGKAAADSLMGLCQTKIFHAQSDPVTNEWSANLIGKRLQQMFGSNTQHPVIQPFALFTDHPSFSTSSHESWEYAVPPHEFGQLKKGGPHNNMECGAIVFQGGRVWSNGESYLHTTIKQGY